MSQRETRAPRAPQAPYELKTQRTSDHDSGNGCCNCESGKVDLARSTEKAPDTLLKEHLRALENQQQLKEMDSIKDLKKLIRKAEKDAKKASKEISILEQRLGDDANLGLATWNQPSYPTAAHSDSQDCGEDSQPKRAWPQAPVAKNPFDGAGACPQANPFSAPIPARAMPFGRTPSPAPQAWLKAISEQDWNELLPADRIEELGALVPNFPVPAGSPWPLQGKLAELPQAELPFGPAVPRAAPSAWPQPAAKSATLEEIRRLMQEMRTEMREVRSSLMELRGEVRELQ